MALIDITKVEVGPRTLTATVRLAARAPRMTSSDLEGTTRVYNLMPHIIEHVCTGDGGETFRDVMGHTELAHLLEHMTVELLAQTNVAGDVTSGRTRAVGDDDRTYEIELACPDDVLVAGALSSAVWVLEWAFGGGKGAEPDIDAIVAGLVGLVESLPEPEPVVVPSGGAGGIAGAAAVGAGAGAAAVDDADGTGVGVVAGTGAVGTAGAGGGATGTGGAAATADLTAAPSSGAMLQLVTDDVAAARAADASATGRLDGSGAGASTDAEATARIPATPELSVAAAADVPPNESPEARQAAADVPLTGDVPLPGVAPLPSPSVTGSLPLSQVVR